MTLDPTQIVTIVLAVIGTIGTGAKVVEVIAPKWLEWRKSRDRVEAEQSKAEREASGAHVAAWVDAERRCGVLEATVARLEERLARYEDQAKRTAAELSRAMAKIDRQAEEIEQLRRRNTELTRELRDAYARLESQPPLTRIG